MKSKPKTLLEGHLIKMRDSYRTGPIIYLVRSSLLIFSLCMVFSCSTEEGQLFSEIENTKNHGEDWKAISDLFLDNSCILVPADGSIQEAIDAAEEGDVIFIEPGTYTEELIINKADLQLIGLPTGDGRMVTITKEFRSTVSSPQLINIVPGRDVTDWSFQSLEDVTRIRARSNRLNKEVFANGIVHYTFTIRVGGRAHDLVGLHRVVREFDNGTTAPTQGAVFMIHGTSQGFDDIFLHHGTNEANAKVSSPIYLAENGVDVWGIDLGWTKIPAETNDFSFMRNWGLGRDIDHTLRAMGVARVVRVMTGQGFGKLNLLGFSYGALVAYAAASRETQEHRVARDIGGIIPVDQGMKFGPNDEPSRLNSCSLAAVNLEQLEAGIYHDPAGQGASFIGILALSDPQGASPVVPGLTNYQAALFVGGNTYLTRNIPDNFWHFVAGDITQPTDIPSALVYTNPNRWFSLIAGLPPFQTKRMGYDATSCLCDEIDVAFDDYLDQITIPIFYIGAAGGTGVSGEYTLNLTASNDISSMIVSLAPPDAPYRDFGHADLFMAPEASTLVWEPLRLWLQQHED